VTTLLMWLMYRFRRAYDGRHTARALRMRRRAERRAWEERRSWNRLIHNALGVAPHPTPTMEDAT
jgi:truncated hemoglobin YjbI